MSQSIQVIFAVIIFFASIGILGYIFAKYQFVKAVCTDYTKIGNRSTVKITYEIPWQKKTKMLIREEATAPEIGREYKFFVDKEYGVKSLSFRSVTWMIITAVASLVAFGISFI